MLLKITLFQISTNSSIFPNNHNLIIIYNLIHYLKNDLRWLSEYFILWSCLITIKHTAISKTTQWKARQNKTTRISTIHRTVRISRCYKISIKPRNMVNFNLDSTHTIASYRYFIINKHSRSPFRSLP